MKFTPVAAFALSLGCALVVTPGFAQTVAAGQGVADRPHPEYDPVGLPAGSFTLLPAITFGVQGTDNYLATDTGRRGDIALSIGPELAIRSNWSRHRLDASAFYAHSFHAQLPGENTSQYGGTLHGVYDLSRQTQFHADLSAASYVESRSSLGAFQSALEPVHHEDYRIAVGGAHTFNDLTLNWEASDERLTYHNAVLAGGIPIDQHYRNVNQQSARGSAQYALGNGLGLIVSGGFSRSLYSFRPGSPGFISGTTIDRYSSGGNVLGGITFELTKLVYGSVEVGYLQRNYHDPRLRNFSGPSFDANLLWNVTPLTTVRLRARRAVEETSSPLIAGNTVSDFSVAVDHELYRYLIVTGDAGYGSFRPNGPGIGGNNYTLGASARYLSDRRFTLSGNIRYSGRSSDSSFLRYHAITGGVAVRVAF